MNLLFVCTGNTCRSPLAEVIGRAEAEARGLSGVSCASAGTFALPGSPASEGGVAAAAARGLDLTGHRSRRLSAEMLDRADVIVGMEPSHAAAAARLAGDASVHVMTDFLPPGGAGTWQGIPDPYGGGPEEYAATRALLDRAVRGLFDWLRDTGRVAEEP